MKKILFAVLATLCSLSTFTTAQAADLKIAVVNPARVLDQIPQSNAIRQRLELEVSRRKREIEQLANELKRMNERLERDAIIMGASEKTRLERDILAKNRALKDKRNEATDDLRVRQGQELQALQKEIYEVILNVAKSQGYDLIIGDGVVYAADRIDITEVVVQQMKNRYGQ